MKNKGNYLQWTPVNPFRTGWFVLFLFLAACASSPPSRTESGTLPANYGRYSINQDRAPSKPLDPSQLREVIPVPVARTLAGNKSPYTVNGQSYHVMATEAGYAETGYASWYGEKFHGHLTSNGEVFDMYQISGAHKSLPIPSFVRVTNLENNLSTVVRVNDRGPFHSDRILDLSYAAAWKLGFADKGTARVRVEAIVPGQENQRVAEQIAATEGAQGESRQAATGRFLQVGAYTDIDSARQISNKVQRLTSKPVIIRSQPTDTTLSVLHRVRIGPLHSDAEVEAVTAQLLAADLGRPYTVNE
ncbi:MAG: septal ring lytic transglycosylase RlpA family protein [Pseudomonadales bacterium]|nr:septal ring lytic transglycosylase RlpA family protein [Pseudomonadales bacterium]